MTGGPRDAVVSVTGMRRGQTRTATTRFLRSSHPPEFDAGAPRAGLPDDSRVSNVDGHDQARERCSKARGNVIMMTSDRRDRTAFRRWTMFTALLVTLSLMPAAWAASAAPPPPVTIQILNV